jgi:hypothetical protein
VTGDRELRVSDPADGRELTAWVRTVGDDVVVVVGGGERPHVGCVVMAVPVPSRSNPGTWSASCSVLTIPPHKEEPMARGVAARVASSCGRVAVVTAGVHDDDLNRSGIESYLRLADELADEVARFVHGASRHR